MLLFFQTRNIFAKIATNGGYATNKGLPYAIIRTKYYLMIYYYLKYNFKYIRVIQFKSLIQYLNNVQCLFYKQYTVNNHMTS